MNMIARCATSILRFLLAALVSGLTACAAPFENLRDTAREPPPTDVRELKVLSFNIRLAAGRYEFARDVYHLPHGKNLAAVVAAIASADADVVALQEVAGAFQAEQLARALNLNFTYEGHSTGSPRASWWGVAVLSKFPIASARGTQISAGVGDTKHIIAATLTIGARPITVVSIHKDKDLHDGESLRNVLAAIAEIRHPVILAGDLNIQPGDDRLEILAPRFVDTATQVDSKGARYVALRGTGFGRIDYVFAEAAHFRVLDVGLLDTEHEDASDHLGYWARLALR